MSIIHNMTSSIQTNLIKAIDIESQIVMLKYLLIMLAFFLLYECPELFYFLKMFTFFQIILVVSAVLVD